MRILLTGASGLIGAALAPFLTRAGHEVVALARGRSGGQGVWWDPAGGRIDLGAAGRLDGVVHLAGEGIASLWTRSKKERIRSSRVEGTRLLAEALTRLDPRPGVLISASATGYYGNRGEEELDESSPAGGGFLAEVCREWEAATGVAEAAGMRVVHLRTGMVLSRQGGALGGMLPVFRMGLGGRLGDGKHYWSWILLHDVLRVILHLLERREISGPVNNVAPGPVTNREFTRELGRVLRRPVVLPVPALLLRGVLGGMAGEMLLASTRAVPRKLIESGFRFEAAALADGLQQLWRVR